jgi:hypothetical protein
VCVLHLGPGPLVSTPLRHSFQRRRRLPPLGGANQNRLSWTLGGRPAEESVRRDSRQRWSLHLGDDTITSPFSRQNSPSTRSLLRSSVSGELNGSRSRAGPWSPLCRGTTPVQYRTGGVRSPFRSPSPATAQRGRKHSGTWRGSRDVISPVLADGTAAAQRAVLPELHTSTLIEHGDDPCNVQSVALPAPKPAKR